MQKRWTFLILTALFLLANTAFSGTLKILLVDDDNYSSPDHLPTIEQAITDAGYSYDLFNAQDSARSPDAALMSKYNLVFWYNANDGKGGYFWDGKDTVNTEIVSYLNNGGWMWVMGNDVIYDMYGKPPDTLQTGDFLYDYFGVQSYDVQSKGDDGGVGVPMLIRVSGQDVATAPDTIRWKVSGLWWADGCTPRPEAQAVYDFGGDGYPLAGYHTAIFYDNGTSKALGTYFDAYYIDPNEDRVTFFKSVLDYFYSQLAPTFPPTKFSLIEPKNEKWIAIGNADEKIHFSWGESTDPDGTPVSYRLYLGTTQDVSESTIIEKDTTATSYDLLNSELYGFLGVGDTLDLFWSVRAKDGDGETTWASDTFKVTVVHIVNQPPNAFHLTEPSDQSRYIVNNMDDSLRFAWETPVDPEGGMVTRKFIYWSEGDNGFKEETDVSGDEVYLNNATLLNLLSGADSLEITWTVEASDQFEATTYSDTFHVNIINEYNVITQAPQLKWPEDNMPFFFTPNHETGVTFQWMAAQAYHNPLYTVTVYDADGNVVWQGDTTATELEYDFQNVLANTAGDTVTFTWNVNASLDDSVNVAAENGAFSLLFVRQKSTILVVFDDNSTSHADVIRDVLDHLNLGYDEFECGNDGSGYPQQIPTFDHLKDYDMVFWFTGNDGKRLAFWNGHDSVNTDLEQYLNNGGKLWLAGNDFLYDVYGGAPDTFQTGDFVYDYLGISSYDAQSKKDDGGKGVPLLYLDKTSAPAGMFALDTLKWKYSGLWYADAVTPVEGATVVYRMGPDDYALAGSPAMIYYHTADFLTVTSTFNPRQFKESNHYAMLHVFLFDGLNWMQNQILTDIENQSATVPANFAIHQNYPNPFNPTTAIPVELPAAGKVQLIVYNVLGQKVLQHSYRLSAGRHLLRVNGMNLASGIYYYQVKFKNTRLTKKMMLLK